MNRIIITISDEYKSFNYDIEIPTDLTVDKLTDDIVQALMGYNPNLMYKLPQTKLYVPKLKRILESSETMEGAGVFNGDYIIIR